MSRFMKNTTKVISVILSIVLLCSIFPMQTFAEEYHSWQSKQETITNAETDATATTEFLYEVTSKRESNKKVFKKSDGTYTAMVSPVPMHYEKDGKWVEIDNSLTVKNKKLQNINGNFNVTFPEHLHDSPVSILNDTYQLTFSLTDANNSKAKVKEKKVRNKADETPADEVLDKLSSTVTYKNIFKHTDLEYILSGNSIKENIIIKKASAAQESYSFYITADGLTGVMGENGEIVFHDAENNEIFKIPSPVMIDAENAVSKDIAVNFVENENGGYTLCYTPSEEWLDAKDRKYPVKLDPVVEEVESYYEYRTMVSDAFYNENFYEVYPELEITPENYWEFGDTETYFYPLPPMDYNFSNFDLYSITLSMRGQVNGVLGAYYVNDMAWEPQSITYETRPETEPEPFDYYYSESDFYDEGSWITFDLTEYHKNTQWFNGIMIRLMPEYSNGEPDELYAIFNRLPNDDQNEIFLYFEYRDKEYFSIPSTEENYSASAGRAGTATINEGSGHLSVTRSDIAISGNIMPAQISFGYNTIKAWRGDYKYYNATSKQLVSGETQSVPYGKKWLSDYNKFFFMTDEGETDAQYMYYDGGNVIPLSVSKEDGKWIIREAYTGIYGSHGYEFDVDVPEGDTRELYEIFDCITVRGTDGYLQSYDTNGRLVKIYKEKYPNQSIDIAYVSSLAADNNYFAIDYVTDGAGRKYDFTYTDGSLSSIQCYAADGTAITAGSTTKPLKMTYGYTNAELTTVTFPDEKKVSYGSGMSYMKNIDGYSLAFSGSDGFSSGYTEKAVNADGKTVIGGSLSFSRSGNEVVILQNGKSVTKRFDNYGRPLMIIDENGNCSYYDYSNSTDGMPAVSAVRTASGNLLTNGGFENGLQAWTAEGLTATDISTEHFNTGTSALKYIGTSSGTKSLFQTVSNLTAGIYTFSAYVKAASDAQTDNNFKLMMTALSENGTVLKEEIREMTELNTDFSQYYVTAEAPSGTRSVKVCISTDNASDTFFIDDIQLEKSAYASDANYILNGSFTDGFNGWKTEGYKYTNRIIDGKLNKVPVKAVDMSTDILEHAAIKNTVSVNGKKDDVIAVGAWVAVPKLILKAPDCILDLSRESDPRYADFTVEYTYTDESGNTQTETSRIDLTRNMQQWTYLRHTLTLKGDCASITVSFRLSGAFSEINIANVDVMKSNERASSATEEIPENIPEEIPDMEETHFCVCGSDCAYGYDCECTCTSAESCTCDQCKGCQCEDCTEFRCECRCENEEVCDCPQCKKKFDITYDEFGNLLSLKLMGKDLGAWLAMMTSRSYDSLGNYMTSTTDGNGYSTLYNYNPSNGVLNSMVDARGNITEYTYDAIGALTQIKTPVSELTNLLSDDMITSYEYTNDRVSKIRHNDFSYNITYDEWGNVKSIFVGALDTVLTIPFVEYTYGTGDYRSRIEKVSFKNGNTISYRYDGDLLTGISYNNGQSYQYEYAYDELGYLIRIIDNVNHRKICYNSDSVEVYENNSLLYKAYTDSDGNFAELINGTLFVTKQYDSQLFEETGEKSAKTGITVGDNELSVISKTDKFGRRTEQSVLARQPENENSSYAMVTTDYTYKQYEKNGETMAGSRIDTISNTVKVTGKAESTPYAFAYEYDENNNITHEYAVDKNGNRTLRYRYTYDEANQLVRCDDNVVGKTYVYTYNKGGNRIMSKVYAYTLGTELGEMQSGDTALYTDPIWRDRMSSFHGKLIVYDKLGNPKSYDGNTYTWEGRQLKSVSNDDGKTEFIYDSDGLRVETRVYDATQNLIQTDKYIWKAGVIDSHTLIINGVAKTAKLLYGSDNQPIGYITNDGESILFVKNIQGDVIALVDDSGKVIVEYRYDSWGNMTYKPLNDTTQAQAERFVKLCPITYRGYNYDFTTGLYYLQSRYYNPEWGRFLNCDDTNILLATQGKTHGANMFAYCENDPVNRVDYSGFFSKKYHYDMSYDMAKSVLKDKYAKKIAAGSRDVDIRYSPLAITSKYYQSFHFNVNIGTGLEDSRIIRAEEMIRKGEQYLIKAKSIKNRNFKRIGDKILFEENLERAFYYFGMALHPMQDMIAHSGTQGQKYGYFYFNTVTQKNLYSFEKLYSPDLIQTGVFYHHLPDNAVVDNPETYYLNTGKKKDYYARVNTAILMVGIICIIFDYDLADYVFIQ